MSDQAAGAQAGPPPNPNDQWEPAGGDAPNFDIWDDCDWGDNADILKRIRWVLRKNAVLMPECSCESLMSTIAGETPLPPQGSGQSSWLMGLLTASLAAVTGNVSARADNVLNRTNAAIKSCSGHYQTLFESLVEAANDLTAPDLLRFELNYHPDTYLPAEDQERVFEALRTVSTQV